MKVGEYRAMTSEELLDRVDTLQKDLFNLRLRNVTRELEDTSKVRAARREIAVAKTILRERRIVV